MAVIDLIARRLERLEKAQKETNETLDRIIEVLESHTHQFERMEDVLAGLSDGVQLVAARVDVLTSRLDRLATALASGRTQDLIRFDEHEKRLRALEQRGRRVRNARKRTSTKSKSR